ncbi:MAG: hypothetical protein ACREAU_03585 [Nitrosopumilaceae archaeon]
MTMIEKQTEVFEQWQNVWSAEDHWYTFVFPYVTNERTLYYGMSTCISSKHGLRIMEMHFSVSVIPKSNPDLHDLSVLFCPFSPRQIWPNIQINGSDILDKIFGAYRTLYDERIKEKDDIDALIIGANKGQFNDNEQDIRRTSLYGQYLDKFFPEFPNKLKFSLDVGTMLLYVKDVEKLNLKSLRVELEYNAYRWIDGHSSIDYYKKLFSYIEKFDTLEEKREMANCFLFMDRESGNSKFMRIPTTYTLSNTQSMEIQLWLRRLIPVIVAKQHTQLLEELTTELNDADKALERYNSLTNNGTSPYYKEGITVTIIHPVNNFNIKTKIVEPITGEEMIIERVEEEWIHIATI